MAEFPALPLFTDALLADCGHLTDAEMGLYLRLLMLIWRTPGCKIPNDQEWVARRLSRSPEQVFPLVKEFCQTDGNFITQKRLFKEYIFVKKMSKRGSDNAKSRWNKKKELCYSNANQHESGNAPTPTPTPTSINIKKNNINTISAADDKSSSPVRAKNEIIFDLLNGKFLGYEYLMETWKNAYPAVDIPTQLAKAAAWLMANPANRKSNYARFLTNWLTKAQDNSRPNGAGRTLFNQQQPVEDAATRLTRIQNKGVAK